MFDVNNVTIQDCIELKELKGQSTVINDGEIVNFIQEESVADYQSNNA